MMKALLGIRVDGTIGLITSSKLDDLTDNDVLEHVRRLGSTGWRNMVVLDTEPCLPPHPGQVNCRLRRVVTQIVG